MEESSRGASQGVPAALAEHSQEAAVDISNEHAASGLVVWERRSDQVSAQCRLRSGDRCVRIHGGRHSSLGVGSQSRLC